MTVSKYLRISSEDGDLEQFGKVESNSISNQRNLLDTYISRVPEFAGADIMEFCDDGWSGKNFERPAVQNMIAQARQGKIQCIIVKDLSRFGRDHLTVDSYICRVFPFLGVRFIAVNDGFDSSRSADVDSLETSFKTLLYDLYSRDLSRKVRSANAFRAKRGEFLAPFAPYGYKKDPEHKNHLIVDPPAAETVRRIFRLTAEGHSSTEIARTLNREAVLTPMLYKKAAGCSRTRWHSIHEENFWTKETVIHILRDLRYTGVNVYGRRIRDRIGHSHTVKVNPTDWIIVEGVHEGIVSRDEFDRAQAAMQTHVKPDSGPSNNPLRGKVRCGICGYAMVRPDVKKPTYYCRTARMTNTYACTDEGVPEEDILKAVLESLKVQASIAIELQRLWEECRQKEKQTLAALRKELTALSAAQDQRERQTRELYEAFFTGELSKAAYIARKAAIVKQKEEAAVRIRELEKIGIEDGQEDRFVSSFQKYAEITELTGEIAEEVLEKVLVFPEGRLEIVWKYRDEYEKLIPILNGNGQQS